MSPESKFSDSRVVLSSVPVVRVCLTVAIPDTDVTLSAKSMGVPGTNEGSSFKTKVGEFVAVDLRQYCRTSTKLA